MSLRFKISFFLICISLIGVIGSTLLVLRKATEDKKKYVTELSSALAPEIKDSIDQKNQNLIVNLNELTEILDSPTSSNVKYFNRLKMRLDGVEALFVYTHKNKFLTIQINPQINSSLDLHHLGDEVKAFLATDVTSNRLTLFKNNLYLFKTPYQSLAAVLLAPNYFKKSFELARGKNALLINSKNQIIYSDPENPPDINFISKLPTHPLTGSKLFSAEQEDDRKNIILTHFAKIESINDSFVLMLTPAVSWQDLATPLLKSSLSFILILILFSVFIAYSISRSLALPIELLAEETSKVGQGVWKPMTTSPGDNEIGKLAKAFNLMILNLKRREQQLQLANNKVIQSESLAAVGRIAAGITHEVKNPLSSILSYCQLIEISLKSFITDPAAAPLKERIEKFSHYNKLVLDDTRRANKIISDLLTFSRQKRIQLEKTDLIQYLTSIEPKFRAFCEASMVDFHSDLSSLDSLFFVEIDQEQIYQVLFNLIQNSIHALKSKPHDPRQIKLLLDVQETSLTIRIVDNGPGISAENINKIFEPFFSTKKIGEGSGLGLALCYGIIQQHQGQILVESVLDESTCFKVKLPRSA